jgi:hypothetical protein
MIQLFPVVLRLLLAIAIIVLTNFSVLGQSPTGGLTPSESDELKLYREYVPKIVEQLKNQPNDCGVSDVDVAYNKYLGRFYEQATDLRNLRIQMYSWQLIAGNALLGLVLLMSIGGFAITVFQIYQLRRLNDLGSRDTVLDVSLHRIQLTTSVTGIVVLIVSFIFLIVFLHEVYSIHTLASTESATSEITR